MPKFQLHSLDIRIIIWFSKLFLLFEILLINAYVGNMILHIDLNKSQDQLHKSDGEKMDIVLLW